MKFICCISLFFALCGSAQADAISRGITAAESRWGPVPGCTSVTVRSLTAEITPAVEGGGTVRGVVVRSIPCTIFLDLPWFASAPDEDGRCSVVQHEIGHLHGLEHGDNPSDVMFAHVDVVSPECNTGAIDPRRADGKPRVYKRKSDRKWCRRNLRPCATSYLNLFRKSVKTEIRVDVLKSLGWL